MPIECPQCGSRSLRYSRLRSFGEKVRTWVGIRPLRCRDCHKRFISRTWRLADIRFARCPRCWRMDLALWSQKDAHIGFWQRLALNLGAKPYRCEYCRVNFVSFRARHERFAFNRWVRRKEKQERTGERAR